MFQIQPFGLFILSNMTADELSNIAAGLMNMSFPDDKEKLYFLCTMTNREAWMKGKWHGMIKEFHVNIKTDYEGRQYITAPDDHNVLLGINLNSKPVPIKNHWFQFHRNSNGSVSKEQGWNMTGSAMDMGNSPVGLATSNTTTKLERFSEQLFARQLS